ncbi:MAG: arginine--tRNA ligase, partial [Bacteroidales bacterium]|nr:arginine--tRNA ligase [Bacteroidales bacterium]
MRLENTIANAIGSVLKELYGIEEGVQASSIQKTRKEFDGDFTFVVFPYVKLSRKSPEQTAQEIGGALKQKMEDVAGFNVVKGFLNISLSTGYWKSFFASSIKELAFGHV